MLGWEFPPLFSGGLGVATYGIVKALHQLSHIRLIIPTAGNASDLEGVNIIGLNRVAAGDIDLEKLQFSLQFQNVDIEKVAVKVGPYHYINDTIYNSEPGELNFSETSDKLGAIHSIFSG